MPVGLPKYVAEFLGTVLLAGSVAFSVLYALPFTPVVAAFALCVGVYVLGPISGAHFNPAISIGFWSVGKLHSRDAIGYIIAQLVAAVAVYILVPMLAHAPLTSTTDGSLLAALTEAIGALILAMGVASVAYGKVKDGAGIAVGGSLLIGIFFATAASDGILNPAVALATGTWAAAYAAGPIIGALGGIWLYRWMIGAK